MAGVSPPYLREPQIMINQRFPNNVLILTDSNFVNLCNDASAYISKLKTVMASKNPNGVNLYTVPGKYGVSNIDSEIAVFEDIDDKNKTLFQQTIENSSIMFDELLVVTLGANDNFLNGAKETVTLLNKAVTQYGYQRKA